MRLLRLPTFLLSILLVLVMPIEQGRCMCGSALPHASRAAVSSASSAMSAAMASGRCHSACCSARAAAHSRATSPAPSRSCTCASMTAATMPMLPGVPVDATSVVAIALLPSLVSVEPVSEPIEHPLALDVGKPPLPIAAGAHGLRAPPAAA